MKVPCRIQSKHAIIDRLQDCDWNADLLDFFFPTVPLNLMRFTGKGMNRARNFRLLHDFKAQVEIETVEELMMVEVFKEDALQIFFLSSGHGSTERATDIDGA